MKNTLMFALAASLSLIGSVAVAQSTKPFPDVPKDHWAYQAVMELKKKGILIGYPDGTFNGKTTGLSPASLRGHDSFIPEKHGLSAPTTIKIERHGLIGAFYEWIGKDVVVAWLRKPKGEVAAALFALNSRREWPIGGTREDQRKPFDSIFRQFKVSPDGKRVLYLLGGRGDRATSWRAGDLNGEGFTGGDLISSSRSLVWMPDSTGWLGLGFNSYDISIIRYHLDGVTPPKRLAIDDFKPADYTLARDAVMLGLNKDGDAVLAVWDFDQTRPVNLFLVDTKQGHLLPGGHQVLLPEGAHVLELSLSHHGDRIAWLLHRDFQQVINSRRRSVISVEIWISKSDGSDMKRLYSFAPMLMQPDQIFGDQVPIQPRWTIDDMEVSYIQGNRIHRVNTH